MPPCLQILGVIALTLHILFVYFLNPTNPPAAPRGQYFTPVVATIVIILILLIWFVLPVRIGG